MFKSFCLYFVLVCSGILLTVPANGALVEHHLIFTQTYFHPNFGARNLTGQFFVDDSILGQSFAGRSYGPDSSEMNQLFEFTVSLGGTFGSQAGTGTM